MTTTHAGRMPDGKESRSIECLDLVLFNQWSRIIPCYSSGGGASTINGVRRSPKDAGRHYSSFTEPTVLEIGLPSKGIVCTTAVHQGLIKSTGVRAKIFSVVGAQYGGISRNT